MPVPLEGSNALMTNHGNARRNASVFFSLCLILAAALFVTGAGRTPATPRAAGPDRVAPVALEITPGIAHADVDVLDLQLD